MSFTAEQTITKIKPSKLITTPDLPSDSGSDFPDFQKLGYFAVVFLILLTSMQIRQDTVITQSKEISANASLQNMLNNKNAQIKFSILPDNAQTATINRVQDENQQYSATREDIQNSLITTRQNAQTMMTQTSTNVNILQQDASEDSGWLQTLNTVFQVIDSISRRG